MDVHIVSRESLEHVLGRMAISLALWTRWTIGPEPRRDAEVNYYFPYLHYRARNFDGKRAAYFTHREAQSERYKFEAWTTVDRACDLRIVTARQYLSAVHAPAYVATPPLDRDKFCPPRTRSQHVAPFVGASGHVYKTGRKGEHLFRALAQSFEDEAIFVASGSGNWGIRPTNYAYSELEHYFQALDVYVCTSTIEGVPYPALEALACGCICVLPESVGLIDELGVAPGVIRYQAGDFDALRAALSEALEFAEHELNDRVWAEHSEARRALTEGFTVGQWATDHLLAFKELDHA